MTSISPRMPSNFDQLVDIYPSFRSSVMNSHFKTEALAVIPANNKPISESDFLREAAWVILNSGFRESTVRKHWSFISLCYFDWESADLIREDPTACIDLASTVFANFSKLEAISACASIISDVGLPTLLRELESTGYNHVMRIPFIGKITVHHLARNLGFPSAKPDRHIVRLAQEVDHEPISMCRLLAEEFGDPIGFVDYILWRYLVSFGIRSA